METLSFPGDNSIQIQRSSYDYLDKQSGKRIIYWYHTYLTDISHWHHSPFNSNLSYVTRPTLLLQYFYLKKVNQVKGALELSQTPKVKLFAKIVNCRKPSTIFAKSSILDVWLGSEYPTANVFVSHWVTFGSIAKW